MFFRRKAILLVHGFVGGIYDFDDLPNELELDPKYDVYAITLPGHERTIVSGVKYQEWIKKAEDQMEYLINHNYRKIYVIGHSMGGVIAAHLASKYPQVKKLVLAAPAYRYFYFTDGKVNIKKINETIKNVPSLLKTFGREKVLDRIIKTPIPTVIEFTKLVSEYQNDIKNVTCPILTIHGLDDKVVPVEATNFVYENNKSTTNILVNIAKVNHECFLGERKNDINNIIISFLKQHPRNQKETIDM